MTSEIRTITFPPVSDTDAAHLTKLFDTMGEFMDVEISAREETIKVLRVNIPNDRLDILTILNKLADSKRKKNKRNGQTT
jgi:hypothetical protein